MQETAKAIIEIANLIKNPKIVLEAAEEMKKAFALTEEEIKKRDEALKQIASFKDIEAEMNKQKASLENDSKAFQAEKESYSQELATKQNECEEKSKQAEKLNEELCILKVELIKREGDVRSLEEQNAKKQSELVARENAIRAREEELSALELRINKILAVANEK